MWFRFVFANFVPSLESLSIYFAWSLFTAQIMFGFGFNMLSAASNPISIEWSWLLYLKDP